MRKSRLLLCLFLLIVSFIVFVLSLLSIFSKIIAGLLLFFSIFFTISTANNRYRFRGFE